MAYLNYLTPARSDFSISNKKHISVQEHATPATTRGIPTTVDDHSVQLSSVDSGYLVTGAVKTSLSTSSVGSTVTHKMAAVITIDEPGSYNTSQNNIMIGILLGVFLSITLLITVSLVAFCRKKNSVFLVQKCEESDSDLEMDTIHNDGDTDLSSDDSDYENIQSSSPLQEHTDVIQGSTNRKANASGKYFTNVSENNVTSLKEHTFRCKSMRRNSKGKTTVAKYNNGNSQPLIRTEGYAQQTSQKCSKRVQTMRKLTCSYFAMPIIHEHKTNETNVSNFCVINETAVNVNTCRTEVNGGHYGNADFLT